MEFMNAGEVIRIFVNILCRDGNLLLNVGPDMNGRIPQEAKNILYALGDFMRENGEAIYGTRAGLWEPVDGVFGSVYKDNTVYLHILDCDKFSGLVLPEIGKTIISASLLDGTEIPFEQKNGISFSVPNDIAALGKVDTVIRLTLLSQ
ncbi:MAG: alpha-L-fucosidase [Oscillospiraceae bacterium]